MNKTATVLTTLVLSGCMFAQTAETGLSGCSLLGLQALDFYSGAPSKGKKINPELKDGVTLWNFGFDAGDTFAVCGYLDEEEIIQQLPSSVTSCKASFNGPDKTVSDLSCQAHI